MHPSTMHAQGRTGTFADFVTASIATLGVPTLHALTPTLQQYPALSPSQRQHVATRLMQVLTALQQQAAHSAASQLHTPPLSTVHHAPSSSTTPIAEAVPRMPTTTAAFREQFEQTAMAMANAPETKVEFEGDQRSAVWHSLRDRRLTASAFGNALGMAMA